MVFIRSQIGERPIRNKWEFGDYNSGTDTIQLDPTVNTFNIVNSFSTDGTTFIGAPGATAFLEGLSPTGSMITHPSGGCLFCDDPAGHTEILGLHNMGITMLDGGQLFGFGQPSGNAMRNTLRCDWCYFVTGPEGTADGGVVENFSFATFTNKVIMEGFDQGYEFKNTGQNIFNFQFRNGKNTSAGAATIRCTQGTFESITVEPSIFRLGDQERVIYLSPTATYNTPVVINQQSVSLASPDYFFESGSLTPDNSNTVQYPSADFDKLDSEAISTTWKSGEKMTSSTPTTFNVPAQIGEVVFESGAVERVFGAAVNDIPVTDILTQPATRIGMNSAGGIVQLGAKLSPEMIRDYVILGTLIHPDGEIIRIVDDRLSTSHSYSQFVDHMEAIGVVRKEGLVISVNADLTFNCTGGILESPGIGHVQSNRGLNYSEILPATPVTFARVLGLTNTVETSAITTIDPGFYDDGSGTKAAVPQPNDATIIGIYQGVDPGAVFVAYGQKVYPSLQDAEVNRGTDIPQLPDELSRRSNLIGRIAVTKSCTNLTDIVKAQLFSGSKFGVDITM